MSEFCAGVKILLERMKSNPEDFEMLDFDVATSLGVQGRFYDFAQSIEGIILGTTEKGRPYRDWHYFTEEERQALIDGFKEMKRAKFDKGIMERVFDERYIERQQEQIRQQYQTQSQYFALSKQNAAQQMQPGTFITTGTNTGGGLMGAIGLGGFFK
jgi:hypothetical protein